MGAEQGLCRAGGWGSGGGVYHGRCSSHFHAHGDEPVQRETGAAEVRGLCDQAPGAGRQDTRWGIALHRSKDTAFIV